MQHNEQIFRRPPAALRAYAEVVRQMAQTARTEVVVPSMLDPAYRFGPWRISKIRDTWRARTAYDGPGPGADALHCRATRCARSLASAAGSAASGKVSLR